MTTQDELRRAFQQAAISSLVNEGIPSKIGRRDGTVAYVDPGGVIRRDKCWARVGADETEMVVRCISVPQLVDAPVIVANRQGVPTVIRADEGQAANWFDGFNTTTPAHAWQHLRRGFDPLYIESLAIYPLLVWPTTPVSMSVYINPGLYYLNGQPVWYDGETTADLSSYIPSSTSVRHFVIIAIDTATNGSIVIDGNDIAINPLFPDIQETDITAVSIDASYRALAAIVLYSGMTAVTLPDVFLDMRAWIGSGASVAPFVVDSIMTDADGAVMVDADGNVMAEV